MTRRSGDRRAGQLQRAAPSLIELHVRIRNGRITVTNNMSATPFPVGIVAEGLLLWNGRVGKWIIARTEADRDATEAGGCSDGPEVVDLEERVYWTC